MEQDIDLIVSGLNDKRDRANGVDELYDLIDDIYWIENEIANKPWLIQKKYWREYSKCCSSAQDDYLCLLIPEQHEITNKCYESVLEYDKYSFFNKLGGYL